MTLWRQISDQLIKLFRTMYDITFPPAENKENSIEQATDILIISKVLDQLQTKCGNQPIDRYEYKDDYVEKSQMAWQNNCSKSPLCNHVCQVKSSLFNYVCRVKAKRASNLTGKARRNNCSKSPLCNHIGQTKSPLFNHVCQIKTKRISNTTGKVFKHDEIKQIAKVKGCSDLTNERCKHDENMMKYSGMIAAGYHCAINSIMSTQEIFRTLLRTPYLG